VAVAALLGFVSGVAVVLGVGLVVSDVRYRRRAVPEQSPTPSTVLADEVEEWLANRG